MVCEKCEKKLGKVIVPDKWKEGASNTTEGGGRKINENKLLSKKNRCIILLYAFVFLLVCNILAMVDGPHMETLNASSANSKCTRMASTATLVLTVKEFVQCVESKFWTPSFTNKAMCSGYCLWGIFFS
ncbi:unnamed protein product [Lupinus luteus]|uniref:Cysteine-rich PDZ-binding protein n=1 Tax=Lupinus luteus TaxID=3873 RepID=A0AAV1X544_LUPLU